jgi:hypothetical protein
MGDIENQIQAGWKEYYRLIALNRYDCAKRVFERTTALIDSKIHRKTTQRMVAQTLAILEAGK